MGNKSYITTKRLTAMLLLVAGMFLSSQADLHAQAQRVVFPDRSVTVGEAFRAIEEQTELLISYNKSDFNLTRKVKLSHNNLSLTAAMGEILARTNTSYLIRGNHLLIVPVKAPRELPVEELGADTKPLPEEVVVEEKQPAAADTVTVPEIPDLTKPPVDVDSLERILRERKEEVELEIPGEPQLERTKYYLWRDEQGFVPGKPAYTGQMPKYALRTNLLYAAAALAPNIGAEFGVGSRSTILTAFSYNGWNTNGTASDNEKLCHWIAQAEYRRWLCESFNGHFFGVNAYYGYYNIGGKKIPMVLEKNSDRYRYKGNVAGAGVSYGYQLMLGNRWNLEFNAGLGFGVMKYDKYDCVRCGEPVDTSASRTFFAPTKLGVSLVFVIK